MLSAIFFNHPARHSIPSGTDSKTFAVTLLEAAANETIEGEPGVIVLLDELRGRVGTNRGREIDALIAKLRLASEAEDEQFVTPPSAGSSGGMNFNISGNISGRNVNMGGTQHISGDMNMSDDDD